MKKAIFIVVLLLLIIPAIVVPSDMASGKQVTIEQQSNTFPAQQEEVQKLLNSIADELNQASKMTDDDEIKEVIDGIKRRVKELEKYERAGDTETALKLKYVIAEAIEQLINKLPSASTATTATAAAAATENPLYDELINIRAKIARLIKLEEGEGEEEPVPTVSLIPDIERTIVYPVKVLCGPSFGKEGVQQGSYSTAVNIHNPSYSTVVFYVKAVVAKRPDEPRGQISPFRRIELGPDEAVEIDCLDVVSLLGLSIQATESNLAAFNPVSSSVEFIKGFVVIHTPVLLDVVGVYTASTTVGFSMDIEYISPSTTVVHTTTTTEEEQCPDGCRCLTKAEAEEYGYTLCGGQQVECGTDSAGNMMYCFEPQQAKCPLECECMIEAKAKELGYTWCNGQRTQCGADSAGNVMYCFEPEEELEVECPDGCRCLTEVEAKGLGYTLCGGQRMKCSTDSDENVKYCFEPQEEEEAECPGGCRCLTEAEAREYGYTLCNGQEVRCGTDANGNPRYCFEPVPEETACPTGCECMTEAEAKRLGYTLCLGQKMRCGTNASNIATYCFQKPAEEAGVAKITISPTQARNAVGTQHTITIVVYDANGQPMPSKTIKIVQTGAHTISPISVVTGANGSYNYTYLGQYTGTDKIVVSADGVSAIAYKDWYIQKVTTFQ